MVKCGKNPRFAPAVLVTLVAAAAGCDVTMTVRQYPQFYTPELKTVAVLPLSNGSLHPAAGPFVTDRLVAALKENGTYEVLAPKDLQAGLAAAGINLPSEAEDAVLAESLRRLGGVQAFVTGRVMAFSTDSYWRAHVDDYDGFYGGYYTRYHLSYGHPHYGLGFRYPIYTYYPYGQAYVAVDVAMVDVATGRTLHAPLGPVGGRVRSDGGRLPTSDELLGEATSRAAQGIVEQLAVVSKEVKVNPARDLRTGRLAKDDKLKFTDDFRADEEEMRVVLRLPPQADRNRFRVSIARKGRPEELAEESFAWSRKDESRPFVFSPRKLAGAAGAGQYEVRFYSGSKLVMTRKFHLK